MSEESFETPIIPTHKQRLPLADKVQQAKLREAKLKHLKDDLAIVFSTQEGRRVLRYLMTEAGFQRNAVGGNPALGMDVAFGTIYNCGRESLYLELRQLIPARILKLVEFEDPEIEIN